MFNFRRNTVASFDTNIRPRSGQQDTQSNIKYKGKTGTTLTSQEITVQSLRRPMTDKRRLRSHTGPNHFNVNETVHSYTLPRGENRSRHASVSVKPRSKDDSSILRPYLINRPVRPAPPPPNKQNKKEMPRRKAPPPPVAGPPPFIGDVTITPELHDDEDESLYELPEKSLSSVNVVLKPKILREPPPVPSSPRPSLPRLPSISNRLINEEEYETESIYELEINYQPSIESITPPPPLPPRSMSTVKPPAIPAPVSKPPTVPPLSKPPAIPPLSRPPSFKPPSPCSSPINSPMQEDESYTEMFMGVDNSQMLKEIDEDEYILMEDAIKSRNQFVQKMGVNKKEENAKSLSIDVTKLKLNETATSTPQNMNPKIEEKDTYLEMGTDNYVKMMRDTLSRKMSAGNVPPIPSKLSLEEEDNENYMEMGSSEYTKIVRDTLKNGKKSAVCPPVPPKPSTLCCGTGDNLEKRFRSVPKQKLSFPHFPPPDPPLPTLSHEFEDFKPVPQTEDLYI